MSPYTRLIARLNGGEIENRFGYYLSLVNKGIAGFIIFGGEIETVRHRLSELCTASSRQLIIASDLEQGLGQQIEGGTLFPPSLATAAALKSAGRHASEVLDKLYTAYAEEAAYTGINTILAPVLDINSNPDNPIIATRAFGDDPRTVSNLGCSMLRILQRHGILACGKHFPGHGDTAIDSHISLPVVTKDLLSLELCELIPFREAIQAGVRMIMLGHLSIPALDPSGTPASLSNRVVSFLRNTLRFNGITLTDAMNMGALGHYNETEASYRALMSGTDFVLHPSDPDETASYLAEKGYMPDAVPFSLPEPSSIPPPDFRKHRELSDELAGMAIQGAGSVVLSKPLLIVLDDDQTDKVHPFINALKEKFPQMMHRIVPRNTAITGAAIPWGHDVVVAIYSETKAWKGAPRWVQNTIKALESRTRVFVSFGNPWLLRGLQSAEAIFAYWSSPSAQRAAADRLTARA